MTGDLQMTIGDVRSELQSMADQFVSKLDNVFAQMIQAIDAEIEFGKHWEWVAHAAVKANEKHQEEIAKLEHQLDEAMRLLYLGVECIHADACAVGRTCPICCQIDLFRSGIEALAKRQEKRDE